MKKKIFISVTVIALLLLLDLLSKALIFKYFEYESTITLIKNFLYIKPIFNTGASFGMLDGWQWFFVISAIIVLTGYTFYFVKSKNKSLLFIFCYAFIFAGAMGNLIDRLFLKHVRDFIFIKFFPAIFNVADICITIGVILFIIWCFVDFMQTKKVGKNAKV